jgi:hypothetical protein
MTATQERNKLVCLRKKTDRQLLELIAHRLDSGLELVHGGHTADAEKAFGEACTLLALVRRTSNLELVSLDSRLAKLRTILEGLPVACVRAACF